MNIWDALSGVLEAFGVALGIFAIVAGGLVVWLVVWFARKVIFHWRESGLLQHEWPRAAGILEGVAGFTVAGTTVPEARYRFHVSGVEYFGRDDGSVLKDRTPGATVRVAYNPADPTTNALDARLTRRRWSWLVLSSILIVALVGCALMFLWLGIDALV